MILGVMVSLIVGFGLGIGLGRFARPLAVLVLFLSVAPLGLLYMQETFFPAQGESNAGILCIIVLLLLAPGGVAMFFGSWFGG